MIGILVTDIILLTTMLVGLIRLRRASGGKFELGRLLLKQVRCQWLLLLTIEFLIRKSTFRSQGRHLALDCHRLRDSSNSTSVYSIVPFFLFIFMS